MANSTLTAGQILDTFNSPIRDLFERSFKMVAINRSADIESSLWIRTEFSNVEVVEVGTKHVVVFENHEMSLIPFAEVESAFITMKDLTLPLCFETFKIG